MSVIHLLRQHGISVQVLAAGETTTTSELWDTIVSKYKSHTTREVDGVKMSLTALPGQKRIMTVHVDANEAWRDVQAQYVFTLSHSVNVLGEEIRIKADYEFRNGDVGWRTKPLRTIEIKLDDADTVEDVETKVLREIARAVKNANPHNDDDMEWFNSHNNRMEQALNRQSIRIHVGGVVTTVTIPGVKSREFVAGVQRLAKNLGGTVV